jgi:hypothetical protein
LDFDLGFLNDVAYICRIAEKGPIIHSHLRLTEYRVHSNQESTEIDEGLLDRRDDFLIGLVQNDPQYLHQVKRNLSIRKTERMVRLALSHHLIGIGIDWSYILGQYQKHRVRLRYVPLAIVWMLKRKIVE